MNNISLFWIQLEAERFAQRCLRLYLWSPGECQWAQHHEFSDGSGEWFFFPLEPHVDYDPNTSHCL